jgi:hypothetical protein
MTVSPFINGLLTERAKAGEVPCAATLARDYSDHHESNDKSE